MYKIFVSIEESWEEVETSNLPLEETILKFLELEKINPNNEYRLEEITD